MVGTWECHCSKWLWMVCNHAKFGDLMWYNHQIRWSLNIIQNLAEPLVNNPRKCCQAFLSAGIIWLRPSYGNGPTKAWYISMGISWIFMISPVIQYFPPHFTVKNFGSRLVFRPISPVFHQIRWGPPWLHQCASLLEHHKWPNPCEPGVQKCGCHPLPTEEMT